MSSSARPREAGSTSPPFRHERSGSSVPLPVALIVTRNGCPHSLAAPASFSELTTVWAARIRRADISQQGRDRLTSRNLIAVMDELFNKLPGHR